MDIQSNKEQSTFFPGFNPEAAKENRNFPRYRIKRRILIKDKHGQIQTGHAYDISRQGLQFRCTPQIAFQLETTDREIVGNHKAIFEVKIALPYMNQLAECGVYCTIKEVIKADEDNMRIGLSFISFGENSQPKLDHFIDNLTL